MSAPNLEEVIGELRQMAHRLDQLARLKLPSTASVELHSASASVSVAVSALRRQKERAQKGSAQCTHGLHHWKEVGQDTDDCWRIIFYCCDCCGAKSSIEGPREAVRTEGAEKSEVRT